MPTASADPIGGSTGSRPLAVTVLQPRRGWQAVDVAELWQFRDLLWMLATRDIKVRYKQTALGVVWAVLQPLGLTLIFTILFGKLLGLEARVHQHVGPEVHYAVFVLSGQVLWSLFASSVTASSGSLVTNANIVRKVFFPRLILPLSAIGAPLVDFVVGLGALMVIMLIAGQAFGGAMLLIAPAAVSAVLAALGIGVLFSALSAAYRDFKYVVPYIVQMLFFVTPVIFPKAIATGEFAWIGWILTLNPVSGPLEAMRAAVLGNPVDFGGWALSLGVSVIWCVIGLAYFARVERRFADVA